MWPVAPIALGGSVDHRQARARPGRDGRRQRGADRRPDPGQARARGRQRRIDVRAGAAGRPAGPVSHIEHGGTGPEVRLDRATGTVRISQRLDWFAGARRLRIHVQVTDGIPWRSAAAPGRSAATSTSRPPRSRASSAGPAPARLSLAASARPGNGCRSASRAAPSQSTSRSAGVGRDQGPGFRRRREPPCRRHAPGRHREPRAALGRVRFRGPSPPARPSPEALSGDIESGDAQHDRYRKLLRPAIPILAGIVALP